MRRIGVVVALLMVSAVTACGPTPHVRTAAPQGGNSWTSCAAVLGQTGASVEDLPTLGDGFTPVSVVTCRFVAENNTSGGVDQVAYERRAENNIDALVAALRAPDAPREDGPCTLEIRLIEWFALLDASGRWVRPGVPVDACGKIRWEVSNALGGAPWTDVYRIVPGRSAETAASGCDRQATDAIWVATSTSSERDWATPVESPFAKGVALRVCRYVVPEKEHAGNFAAATILDAAWSEGFAGILGETVSAVPCDTPASWFALVREWDRTGNEVYVELDGCRRVMVRQLSNSGAQQLSLGQAHDFLVKLMDRR
jgi:hypothetical protein